jgi:1-acyl-sn-glycerol-3-phosphate acyltransferase
VSIVSSLPRLLVAGIRTGATYILVSAYILLVGPAGFLFALATRRVDHLYWLGMQGVRLGCALAGLKYVVTGAEHIQHGRAAVFATNHTSNVEPPIIYLVLRETFPRFQILYKSVLRKMPIMGPIFDIAGFVPIDRRNRVQSDRAIAQAVRQIRAGNNFLVFPEGTRSRTGELLPFKKGAFIMAIQAEAPIVPVAIAGAQDAMRKGSPVIWPTTLDVKLGPPVETAGRSVYDRDAIMQEVRASMMLMLEELRLKRATLHPPRT